MQQTRHTSNAVKKTIATKIMILTLWMRLILMVNIFMQFHSLPFDDNESTFKKMFYSVSLSFIVFLHHTTFLLFTLR